MSKFNIQHPGTVRGEAARAMMARMWNHDTRDGVGGYHIKRDDMERLREVLGDNAEDALRDAGFTPHPRHKHQFWTGPRSPYGDGAKIRFEPPWELLRVVAAHFAEPEVAG
ncbi:MAG: hypothetical protein RID23_04475 [Roseovarius sp.]